MEQKKYPSRRIIRTNLQTCHNHYLHGLLPHYLPTFYVWFLLMAFFEWLVGLNMDIGSINQSKPWTTRHDSKMVVFVASLFGGRGWLSPMRIIITIAMIYANFSCAEESLGLTDVCINDCTGHGKDRHHHHIYTL